MRLTSRPRLTPEKYTTRTLAAIDSPNFHTMNVILLLVVACVGIYFFTDAKAKANKH